MSKKRDHTELGDDLEPVEVQPRKDRGAVISVRLTSDEAQRLAEAAERRGVSVSEFARTALRSSMHTPWQLAVVAVSAAPGANLALPTITGGGYGVQTDDRPFASMSG